MLEYEINMIKFRSGVKVRVFTKEKVSV